MEFFFCSPSSFPLEEHCGTGAPFDSKSASVTPAPSYLVESSCSEQSESSSPSHLSSQHQPLPAEPLTRSTPFPKAGSTSPSTVCIGRKLSTAIATSADAKHPVLEGRRIIALPELELSGQSSTPPPRKMSTAILSRSVPTKAPRSSNGFGLPRPFRIQDSSRATTSTDDSSADVAMRQMSPSSQKRVVLLPADASDGCSLAKPVLQRASTAPVRDLAREVRTHPPSLRLDAWSEPAAETFNVRGGNYLQDKAKVPSEEGAFRLLTVDMVQAERPIYTGLCAHPQGRIQLALERERETGVKELPEFIFAVNLCVPGDHTYHQVSYFGCDNFEEIQHPKTPFGRLMHKFIFGESDEFRNQTFKLIPRIVEGNFVVRKAVGSKPTILGRKIKQYYIRGPNYFEVIVDIASDPVAQRIVKLVLGYTKTLVVDMVFLLEGCNEAFLPERVFGGVRLKNIDLKGRDGTRRMENP